MTLFLVLGVVALVIGVLVAVALGMRSKRAGDRRPAGRRRPRPAGYGEESALLEGPVPAGRRAADSRRRSSRRLAGARSGRSETGPRPRVGQDDRYGEYDDGTGPGLDGTGPGLDGTAPGLDGTAPLGRRAGAGARADLRKVMAEADERDRRRPPAKPGRRGGSPRKRPHPGRGRQGRAEEDDWPDSDWTNISEEDFWADISSDKPLATTARSAQSAADLSPSADLDEPVPAERRSRRARAAEPAFDSSPDEVPGMPGSGQETMAFPARSGDEPAAREYEPPRHGYQPSPREYTDPNLAVLASLGIRPPEGPGAADRATDTPPEPLTSSSIPEVPSSSSGRWPGSNGSHSWDAGHELGEGPAASPGARGGYAGSGYGADAGATQAFDVSGSAGYGLPGPGTPERENTSYRDEFYPGTSFPGGSYLSSNLGESRDAHGMDSYGGDSYSGGSHSRGSYSGGSYGGDSNSTGAHLGESYPGESYPGESYPGESYSGSGDRDWDSYPGGSYPGGSHAPDSAEPGTHGSYDRPGSFGHDYGSLDGGSHSTGSYGGLADGYGSVSHGAGSHRSDAYGSDSYSASSYGAGSYGSGSYGTGSYNGGSHDAGSYGSGSYGSGSYGSGSYSAGSYGSDSYSSDSYSSDSYSSGSFGSGWDRSDSGGSDAHEAGAGPGSYDSGSYGHDSHGNGSRGTGSHEPGSYEEPAPASLPRPNASPGRYTGGYLSSSALSARQPNSGPPGGNPYGSYVNGSSGADDGQTGDWSRDRGHGDDPDHPGYGRHRHPPGGRHR